MSTNIPPQTIKWTAAEDDRVDAEARLYGTLEIGAFRLHLDAFAVRIDNGVQIADDEFDQGELDEATINVDSRHNHYTTLEINGRAYAVFGASEIESEPQ